MRSKAALPLLSQMLLSVARDGTTRVPLEDIATRQSASGKWRLNGFVFYLMLDFNKCSVSKKKIIIC